MARSFSFHASLVLRTPRLPLQLTAAGLDLDTMLASEVFMEALFLASPVLHEALLKYKAGQVTEPKARQKMFYAALRYYLRMSSRCTPFGLFSGCALAQWQPDPPGPVILQSAPVQRHTRFDMHYLCALAAHIAQLPFVKNKLLYYPNTSWYRLGDDIRYAEYTHSPGGRNYQLTATPALRATENILVAAAQGMRIAALTALVMQDEGVEEEEAAAFVDEVIASQLLVSELEPAVTGPEVLPQILAVLGRLDNAQDADLQELRQYLLQAHELLTQLDNTPYDTAAYRAVQEVVALLGVDFDAAKLLQTDLFFSLRQPGLPAALQTELHAALNVLNRIADAPASPHLEAFIRRFEERYEDSELPLLQVLDNETGIGYIAGHTGHIMPLLDGIIPPGGETINQLNWGKKERYLHTKLQTALLCNDYTVELTAQDMQGLENDWNRLPPSFAVMFRQVAGGKIWLEHAGGSSGINLLGRFAHGHEGIRQLIQEVAAAEAAANPDVILAEIVHLPESRVGNVLLHPPFRQYEIPFLSGTGVAAGHQVVLQDLYISVQNGRIRLFCRRLGREVVPRLSTAHNYSNNALPVYQFLCDLQLQQQQSFIGFGWGPLAAQYSFLPRVACGKVIVSAAQWNLSRKDIAPLLEAEMAIEPALSAFRAYWKMPALVVLADGDNELLINLDDTVLTGVWLDAVRQRSTIVLREWLGADTDTGVTDEQGAIYANQWLAIMQCSEPQYTAGPDRTGHLVQQRFAPGSEWVYYKLYCGADTADKILSQAIQPALELLLTQQLADSFFFIRYNDPEFHLRVRVHLTDVNHAGAALALLAGYIHKFERQGYIWKVQLDTYQRELQRYGGEAILLAESLFYHDSVATLTLLAQMDDEAAPEWRWLWCIKAIDSLLEGFGWGLVQKLALLEGLKQAFHKEFRVDKVLRLQLAAKYRQYRSNLEQLLTGTLPPGPLPDLLDIIERKKQALQPIQSQLVHLEQQEKLVPSLRQLAESYIHMLVNRVIASSPRLHELVLYDLLYTAYKNMLQRQTNQ